MNTWFVPPIVIPIGLVFGNHRLRKRFESLLNCGRPACFLLNPGNNGFPLMGTISFGSLSLSVASCLLLC